jgi:hypothetical protein
MHIDTELDQDSEKKLIHLQEITHKTITDIIKESVDFYYDEVTANAKKRNQALLKSLAGCASGPEDLSANYKIYLKESLSQKHDSD